MTTIYEQNGVKDPEVARMEAAKTNPAFQSGGATIAPVQPGQNLGNIQTLGAINSTQTIPNAPIAPPVSAPIGQTPAINTGQPSPTSVNATPYTGTSIVDALNQGGQASDFASRTKLAQTYGIQGYTGTADQNTQLLQKYKSGLATAQTSGKTAPATSGAGSQAVNDITGGVTPQPGINPVDTIMMQDKAHAQYLTDYKALTDANAQRTSLVDDYKKMQADANLPELKAESINMKKVIDGTEDDIRNELTKAGGFATESQVLALSGARNKGLIRNYNALQETINNATQNINTMMGLSQQDKQYAIENLKTQLNFDQEEIAYADKMNTNAQSAYQKIIDNPNYGYSGLYQATGGDQHTISMVEKTLGLQPGQLGQLATYKAPQSEKEKLALENQKLQNQKLKQDINAPTGGTNLQTVKGEDGQFYTFNPKTGVYTPSGMGGASTIDGVDEKTMGKIQASPEYKTINGVLPALSTLVAYKDAITNNGTVEYLNGEGKGELQGTYGNALSAWKSLAGLGALSGSDFTLAENAVPAPGLLTRTATSQAKIQASIDNAVTQATNLTKRLIQNYPQAKDNLNKQLDDLLVTAYPSKYTTGPDGQVYEITK